MDNPEKLATYGTRDEEKQNASMIYNELKQIEGSEEKHI